MRRLASLVSIVALALTATFITAAVACAENPLLDPSRPSMPRKSGAVPDPGYCPSRIVPWLPPVPHMCGPHGIRKHPMPWGTCYPGDAWVDTYDPKPLPWLPPTLFGCSPHDQCPTFFPGLIRRATPALDGNEALSDGR